jgi:uncharacterized repeat protein (TIGR03943 family)
MSKPAELPLITSPRRVALAGTFFLWGATIMGLLFTGTMTRYLAPRSLPFAWIAGPVLLAIGVVLWRNSKVPHHGDPTDDMHEVSCVCRWEEAPRRTELTTTALMLLPLLVLLMVPTGVLGADAARTRGVSGAPVRAPGDPGSLEGRDVNVLDIIYASSSPFYSEQIGLEQGDEVSLLGIVVKDDDDPDSFLLTRFFVTCCVADAVPIAVRVRGPTASAAIDNEWVTATGPISWTEAPPGVDATEVMAELSLESLEAAEEPWDIYLY